MAGRWNPLHGENYGKAAQIGAAIAVGVGAWQFSRLASTAQNLFILAFRDWPFQTTLAAPLLFLVAAWVVRRFAPEAKGSGIPQVLLAMEDASSRSIRAMHSPLISLRTAAVKVVSAGIGMLGGASIGREGPTVQIASSIFAFAARKSGRWFPIKDYRSFLVAGAAAGVSAAFNTPLAGIAFALEELAEHSFSQFKRGVMLCVIVAGITARALGGNYLYFGHPRIADPSMALALFAIFTGVLGGLFGGLFSRVLTQNRLRILPRSWWMRALACGAFCSCLAYLNRGATAGSGYESTRAFMDDPAGSLSQLFFPEKFLTTIFSYLSGIAGGIFSPCLSIGAGLGVNAGQWLHMTDLKACALVGMVAFFSGVVHAPLTAVIIIMEMSDQHMLIIPFMIAAYLAHAVGSVVMPVPLYRHLAFQRPENESDGHR